VSGRRLSKGRLATLCLASVGGFLVVASAAKIWPMRLVYNASASVPLGWYAVGDASPLWTGEIVVASLPASDERLLVKRGYLARDVPVLKTIEARAGHRVCRIGDGVTIDGVRIGQARDVDGRNRPLPRWSGCRKLAPDEVFLFNPAAPASFDGRYFGPVSATRVIGRATPLWTW
jgi:conjugative transfer signal peptidase TraF